MNTIQEIKDAIGRLDTYERADIAAWLSGGEAGGLAVAEAAVAYDLTSFMSVDEYLALELDSPLRHEYVAGFIRAMSGASRPHNHISLNLAAELRNHLRRGTCRIYMADIKVRIKAGHDEFVYYPDVMVGCARETESDYFLSHPKLVIEVLSPSTRMIDLREKLANYQRLGSVEEYAVVEQTIAEVTLYRRADGWTPQQLSGMEAVAEFRSVGLSLSFTQIYEGLDMTFIPPASQR